MPAPAEMEVELPEGDVVVVRPVRPEDKPAIAEGFRRMSEQSRYQRFLTVRDALSTKELRYLTEIDHHDHEALIAHDKATGEGVGIGRFIRDPASPKKAEAAVAVVDDWQGRGLGSCLTALMADRAREEGIDCFTALLLTENTAMLSLLESLGPARQVSRDGPLLQVEIDLPESGMGEHMAGVLRVAASGGAEGALPTDELRIPE